MYKNKFSFRWLSRLWPWTHWPPRSTSLVVLW